MTAFTNWVHSHQGLLWTAASLSVVMFIGSLVLVPWLIQQIPHDYFLGTTRAEHRPHVRHPGLRLAALVAKNLLGGILLAAGLAMIFLPGQGLLTLFMGIMFIDFPGKFRLEKRIVCTPVVLRSLNWIRVKRNRPPIQTACGNGESVIGDQ